MLMRPAVRACSTPRVVADPPQPPLVEQNPVLRRGLVDSGGLLKATTSAKSNRSDQALLRNARDRADDADLLQVSPATSVSVLESLTVLSSHCKNRSACTRCI